MPEQQSNVLKLNLSVAEAKKILQQIAADPSRVFFTNHAEERMVERSITRKQVLCCIKHGAIIEGPYREPNASWKLKLETISAGDRVTTVCVLDYDDNGNYCLIVTVF